MNKIIILSFVAVTIIVCRQPEKENDSQQAGLAAKADSLIARTFDTLRHTLQRTIAAKGFDGAVAFCNMEAMGLLTIYAKDGITFRRTSEKLRNPDNAPNDLEQEILASWQAQKNQKQELKPVFKTDAQGNHHYFKPILLQSMCLNCHGIPDVQVQPATWQAIQKYYPADRAFGYQEGDLRGAWHITMPGNEVRN